MLRPRHVPFFALLLVACVNPGAFENRAGSVGESDAGPGEGEASETSPFSRVRQDLSGWVCGDGPQAVAFFDADSTLRVSKIGAVTADSESDVNILPFAAQKIQELNRLGYLVAIVSNQGGVAYAPPDEREQRFREAQGALSFTVSQLASLGARVDYFDFAEAYDDFRKPKPGMGTRLEERLRERCCPALADDPEAECNAGVDRARSLMIGDSAYKKNADGPSPEVRTNACVWPGRPADDFSNADRLFADSYGVWFVEPNEAYGWRDFGVYNIENQTQLIEFLQTIENEAARLETDHGDPARAAMLRAEVAANRAVNGL